MTGAGFGERLFLQLLNMGLGGGAVILLVLLCRRAQPIPQDIALMQSPRVHTGVDALNPLEVKAGMDSLLLKQKYGDRLVLQGGINAVLWDQKDAIIAEIERLVPALKQGGGYIFSSDHSIPNSVSAENFRAILDTVKRVGRY